MFRLLEKPRSVDDLGSWSEVVGRFTEVTGYTYFGNFFLLEPSTQQYAVLYTIDPELVPVNFFGQEQFRSRFLTDPGVIEHLGRPNDVAALEHRLGPLGPDHVFIPCPYPFLGGDSRNLESYQTGNVWTFADLVGQMQSIGASKETAPAVSSKLKKREKARAKKPAIDSRKKRKISGKK